MQKFFLILHVALSLVGILTGFVVIYGLITSQRFDGMTLVFLASTIATSVTGFPPFFRLEKLLPSHVVGVISLVVLALAVYARYQGALAGGWSTTYVVAAVIAQYLNVFVLVVQLFLKVPALKALAPTQKEAPFKIAQSVVLLAFIVGGWVATTSFEPSTVAAVARPGSP
jgi:hypothetical protein